MAPRRTFLAGVSRSSLRWGVLNASKTRRAANCRSCSAGSGMSRLPTRSSACHKPAGSSGSRAYRKRLET
eukprot:138665-Lingulodinium_polyedra.AAC.1